MPVIEINLPINLNPKESISIDVTTLIDSGGILKKFLEESKPRVGEESKYAIVPLIKDIDGNVFNSKGQRLPQEFLDQKWMGDFWGAIAAYVKFQVVTILSIFGLQ